MGTYTTVDEYIEITHCDTARELLDYLKVSDPRWLPATATSSPWIFRGQREAEWELIPHAMRTSWFDELKESYRDEFESLLASSQIRYAPNEFQPDSDTLCDMLLQEYAERYAVEEFTSLADHVGHSIPEDNRLAFGETTPRNVVHNFVAFGGGRNENVYPFLPAGVEFALAQHHGIPTRLLDFTHLSYVAAFFAAEEAVNHEMLDQNDIAVWALDGRSLDGTLDLELVTQRRAKTSYLHAQGSVFVYDRKANWYFVRHRHWRSFENAIASGSQVSEQPPLRKVTMPAKESFELLRLLVAENISRAHLMPTYDNITETLKIMRRITRQQEGVFQSP